MILLLLFFFSHAYELSAVASEAKVGCAPEDLETLVTPTIDQKFLDQLPKAVPNDPVYSIPYLHKEMDAPERARAVKRATEALAPGKSTEIFTRGVAATVRELGGVENLTSMRNELQGFSSNLRSLRTALLERAKRNPEMKSAYEAAAEEAHRLYVRNQSELGKIRLLIEVNHWKAMTDLGLVDIQVTTGKEADAAIRMFIKPTHEGASAPDSPALLVKVNYTHDDLVKLVREGKIDLETYYRLTPARKVNEEANTTAFGSWWSSADEANYSRGSVYQDVSASPLKSTVYEGREDGGGGGWIRGIPPKNSWMVMSLVGSQHADIVTPDQKRQLTEADPKAVAGAGNSIQFYMIPSSSRGGDKDAGKKMVTALAKKDPGSDFTTYTDPKQGLQILYGGKSGTPAMKWNGGSTATDTVGSFIINTLKQLRRARTFAEFELGVPPETRGVLTNDGSKTKFAKDTGYSLHNSDFNVDEYTRELDEFREQLENLRDRSAQFEKFIASYDSEKRTALSKGDVARAEAKEAVRYQTVLDHALVQTELEQLETSLRKAELRLLELKNVRPEVTEAESRTPAQAKRLFNAGELAKLKETEQNNPGGHKAFNEPVKELISHLEERAMLQREMAKANTKKLATSEQKHFPYVIAGDGPNGAYLAQKLVESGVPAKDILIVGKLDSPFLKFMGVGSFETANNTLKDMGVDLKAHSVNIRDGDTEVPSTTAIVEANLNAIKRSGAMHVYGDVVPEKGPDGKSRYFLVDPETQARTEIFADERMLVASGIPYPKAVGEPHVDPTRVLSDVEFYQQAQKRMKEGLPAIDPEKSVLVVGSGGASASVEKVLYLNRTELIEKGGRPGKITIVGNSDTYNNNRRFLLDANRKILGSKGLFEFIEGRVATPEVSGDTVSMKDVKRLPDGRYEVTIGRKTVVVDYVIDAAASVKGKGQTTDLGKAFSPEGFKPVVSNGMDAAADGKGADKVTFFGPAGPSVAGKQPESVGIATSYEALRNEDNNVTLPSGYTVDPGPFAYNAQVIRNLVARLARERARPRNP